MCTRELAGKFKFSIKGEVSFHCPLCCHVLVLFVLLVLLSAVRLDFIVHCAVMYLYYLFYLYYSLLSVILIEKLNFPCSGVCVGILAMDGHGPAFRQGPS